MTKEQLFFIQILADHLNGRKSQCTEDLDWDAIRQYAKKHQVSGLFYVQAKDIMPADMQKVFRQEILSLFYYASNRASDFEKVTTELEEQGVPYFVIKGPAVAAVFPDPKLRVMGDIDLVVKTEDRPKAHAILMNNGYECVSKQDDREWQYFKNKMELELHDRLVYEETVNERGHDTYFNECWKYVKDGQLDWNFHLLFLIFHLRKHFMNAGVGFRQFMDLAAVAKKIDIDWEWMKENLKITGMYAFAKKCYGFVNRWFGITTPLTEDIEEEFFEEATQKIFADGVFGFDNKDNKINASVNEVRKSKLPRLSLLHLYIKELFPPWTLLSETQVYGYLKISKLLLPIAWIHRWCRIIKRCVVSKEKLTTKKTIASIQEFDSRMTWMENWGIMDMKKK